MIGKPVAELSERAGRAPIRAASLAHPVPERKVLWLAEPLEAWGNFKRGLLQGPGGHGEMKPLPWKPYLYVLFVNHVE